MKRFLLSLFFVVAVAASAEAKLVGVGLSAGVSNANYELPGVVGTVDNDTGFQVGANLNFDLFILKLTPEVVYSYNQFSVSGLDHYKVKSNKVDLPVIVGVPIMGIVTIELGPRFTVYDNAKKSYYDGRPSENLGRLNETIGYTAGLKVSIGKVIVGARYNGQFGDYNSDKLGYVRNSSYSVSLGWKM